MNEIYQWLNKVAIGGVFVVFAFWIMPAHADLKEIKKYKEAFADAKPKCINCHMDEKPKKDDGQHEMNAYGKAALKEAKEAKAEEDKPTTEIYKKLGTSEDFEKNAAGAEK